MKILHLGHVPVPDGHPERVRIGPQHPGRWVLNHALAQKAIGLDVEVVSLAHKASCDFSCEIEGVKIHFLRTFHPYRHFTFYAVDQIRMARFVRSRHPDLVHAHGTESAYGWAAQRSGIPYCITAQGLFFQILPTLGRKPTWNERFLRWGEDVVWRRTRYAVAKSEYVKLALASQYPHLELVRISNTYEPALDTPLRVKDSHSIAFVGSMDERKGVVYLLDALRKVVQSFPDIVLHIAGNPPEESASGTAAECLRGLRALLGNRLVLHGKISSARLFSILDGCSALVAPSLEEMFGNQLVEALMRGCHGIVADGTALAENARRFGNSTVVPQRDSAAIARAILSVFVSPPTMVDMENARCNIRKYMSPSVVASLHRDYYRTILSRAVAADYMKS